MISDCINCNYATLCADGALRCDIDFNIATEICDKIDYGRAKLWKLEKMGVISAKSSRKPKGKPR